MMTEGEPGLGVDRLECTRWSYNDEVMAQMTVSVGAQRVDMYLQVWTTSVKHSEAFVRYPFSCTLGGTISRWLPRGF